MMTSVSKVAADSCLRSRVEPCHWRFQMGRPGGMGGPGPSPSDGCSRSQAVKVSGGREEVEKGHGDSRSCTGREGERERARYLMWW